jgi:hypothetical protein
VDERTLAVVIKANNETSAAFAQISGQLAALTAQVAAANGAAGAASFSLFGMGTALSYVVVGATALAAAFAPVTFALGAIIVNTLAWTAISALAIPVIGGLAYAIFQLGAANAGGLSPATEMVKTHHAVTLAIKNHQKALEELAQAKAGIDVYELGKGSRAQNIAFAQAYVTATGQNLADAQHDMGEPVSGMGGPIARLGSGIDDLRHHFEEVSRPFADHIAMWALQFLPVIEKAGDAIAKWFGDRMPAIFKILNILMADFSGFWRDVFTTVGRVVDYFIANSGQFDGFLKGFLGVFAGIFRVTMEVMMNVATWFQKEWPGISKTAGDAAKAIGDGFNVWAPAIKPLLGDIGNNLKDVATNIESLKPLWVGLGFVVGGVLTAIGTAIDAILVGLREMERLLNLVTHLNGGGPNYVGHWQHNFRGPDTWIPGAPMTPVGANTGGRGSGSHGL